ncbi:MAG TPA: hypothetical protein VLF69_05110 [Candidatus Saccharimonadales bacterium]|nr:hypothetical protein [Candidatus Saccharimonadales bacterium]
MRQAKNKKSPLHLLLAALLAVSGLGSLVFVQHAHAATMGEVFVRFDRMATSTATTGTVCAKPATSSTDVKTWTVTFPTGYTVSGTAGNWQTSNISTTNLAWPSGAVAWPNATSATATISTQTVTWTNSSVQTMNNTSIYCYNWTTTAAVSTPSSANPSLTGTIATQDHLAATIDTGSYATAAITNDQIAVTATVPTAFTFALSGNTDALGTLSTGSVSVSPTPRTVTVNTNAKNGWLVWADSASAGLHSSTASYTIGSNCSSGTGTNSTLSAGTEGYNTGVTSSQVGGSGTITVATPFVGGVTGKGGGLCTTYQSLASSTGSADTAVLTLTNNAAIKGSTPAATDYTDTITVVGAGLF